MQATRYIRYTEVMPSQASQLPHLTGPVVDFDVAFASPHSSRPVGRCALAFDLDLRRPVKPRWPNAGSTERVNRQDAGLAATGQGRPVSAARFVLPERGHTEPRRGAEWWGKSLLVTFELLSKVTRCKSGTHISHPPNNGYVHPPPKPQAKKRPHPAKETAKKIVEAFETNVQ